MAFVVDKNRCPQNHRCPMMQYCPVGAITQDGFGLPVIDPEKCIDCGRCAQVCPRRAVFQKQDT